MFSDTMLIVLGGCLLGAMQLMVGVTLGLWLRKSDRSAVQSGRHDMLHASQIAQRLHSLADEMSSSVGEHRSQLDEATRLLTSDELPDDESLAELVLDVVGDIVRANQSLETKLHKAETRLAEQAAEIEAHISRSLTDPLTGLPNRREFNGRLEERMSAWNRRQEVFSLLLLDVDRFKKLNDDYGHLAGDEVLAAIGRTLRGAVRREDAVARYGGEEFAILLPNTSLEQATHVAHKVCDAVAAASVDHNGQRLAVTLSGGLAMIATSERAESLIQRADAALYAAKAAGRNCTFIHDGANCRSVADFRQQGAEPVALVAGLMEQISSPNDAGPTADESPGEAGLAIGRYLPRESISPELAQSCEELRRHVEERAQNSLGGVIGSTTT